MHISSTLQYVVVLCCVFCIIHGQSDYVETIFLVGLEVLVNQIVNLIEKHQKYQTWVTVNRLTESL